MKYTMKMRLDFLFLVLTQFHAAMKALEQRQTALERSEHEVVVAEDELSRLQRGLAEFMSKQGDEMEDDIHDARR
jgi:hypothetical protein